MQATRRMRRSVRLFAGILLAIYVVVVSGMPLPLSAHLTSLMVRYPCENSACGCSSAEKCWRSCCCHTLEQKLAWAAKHQVVVPHFVSQQKKQISSCCAKTTASAPAGCKKANPRAASRGDDSRSILLVSSAHCGGNPLGLSGVVPAVTSVEVLAPFAVISEVVWIRAASLESWGTYPPPTPPPESC